MIVFIDTQRQEHHQPSLDYIIDVIKHGTQIEWEGYSGQAGLYWKTVDDIRRIILTPSGDTDYLLQYFDDLAGLGYYFASFNENADIPFRDISVGGDPWTIPACLFISKTKTVDATHCNSNAN